MAGGRGVQLTPLLEDGLVCRDGSKRRNRSDMRRLHSGWGAPRCWQHGGDMGELVGWRGKGCLAVRCTCVGQRMLQRRRYVEGGDIRRDGLLLMLLVEMYHHIAPTVATRWRQRKRC